MGKFYTEKKVKRMLLSWCPTLDICLLAQGKLESLVGIDCEVYDFIAGKLIAKEAGAIVTDLKGGVEDDEKNGEFIIANNDSIKNAMMISI